MKVKLYVRGHDTFAPLLRKTIDWPDSLELPQAGDFVTVDDVEFEIDHREFHHQEDPPVSLSLRNHDDPLGPGWK